jgi:transcription elongation factor GreA-like protein
LVDRQDLLEIANIIREKNSMSETNYLKFLEDFVNNITNVDNSKIIGELIVNTVTPMGSYIEISFDSSNIQQIGKRWATL